MADPTIAVDISPLAQIVRDYVIPVVGTFVAGALTVIAGWALAVLKKKTGIEASAQAQSMIATGIAQSVALAEHKLDGSLANVPPVQVRNIVAANALENLTKNFPKAIADSGFTPANAQALADKVTASVAIKMGTELSPPAVPAPVVTVVTPIPTSAVDEPTEVTMMNPIQPGSPAATPGATP